MLHRAIDRQHDAALREMTHVAHAVDRAHRGAHVKALANFPRFFLVAHAALQIAPRHVQANGVTIDVAQRVGHGDVFAT